MSRACVLCGSVGVVQRHHLTGRIAPCGDYLDPALVLPLCISCHTGQGGIHQSLRHVGLECAPIETSMPAYRLQRVAVSLRILSDCGRGLVLSPSSTVALYLPLMDAISALAQREDAA